MEVKEQSICLENYDFNLFNIKDYLHNLSPNSEYSNSGNDSTNAVEALDEKEKINFLNETNPLNSLCISSLKNILTIKNIHLNNNLFSKYFKKEEVDKKILRKFKKFLKSSTVCLISECDDNVILSDFMSSVLFPPCTYKEIQFKSVNFSFMVYLFSYDKIVDLFTSFINESFNSLYQHVTNIKSPDILSKIPKDDLEFYLRNMHFIYNDYKYFISNFAKSIKGSSEDIIKD